MFESFVSEGSVSPLGVTESEKPVVVLRDTGADTDLHKSVG